MNGNSGKFVDKWCYLQTADDVCDWSDWAIWEYWEDEFDWRYVSDYPLEQDIVAYRDDVVYHHRTNGSRTIHDAARLVIGRICTIEEDDVYLEVIWSEGERPFKAYDRITTSLERIGQYGCYRWPRFNEPVSDEVTASGTKPPKKPRKPSEATPDGAKSKRKGKTDSGRAEKLQLFKHAGASMCELPSPKRYKPRSPRPL